MLRVRTALLIVASLSLLLAACGQGENDATATLPAWTTEELSNVFDLSELGTDLTVQNEHLVLDGKLLPPDLLTSMPHLTMGKRMNLLKLDDDTLEAMSDEAAYRLKHASPEQLREFMAMYGITTSMLQAAWQDDGRIGLAEIHTAATELNETTLSSAAAEGALPAGTTLLHDLGLTEETE